MIWQISINLFYFCFNNNKRWTNLQRLIILTRHLLKRMALVTTVRLIPSQN